MKNYRQFIPSPFAIVLGIAIGAATQNVAVGIAIFVVFNIAQNIKLGKRSCV